MGTEPAEMNTVYRRLSKHVIEQLSRYDAQLCDLMWHVLYTVYNAMHEGKLNKKETPLPMHLAATRTPVNPFQNFSLAKLYSDCNSSNCESTLPGHSVHNILHTFVYVSLLLPCAPSSTKPKEVLPPTTFLKKGNHFTHAHGLPLCSPT